MVATLNQMAMCNPGSALFLPSSGGIDYNLYLSNGGCGCGNIVAGRMSAPIFSAPINATPSISRSGYTSYEKINAESLAMRDAVEELKEAIINNESSRIVEKWNELKDLYKNTEGYKRAALNGKISEKELNGLVRNVYASYARSDIKADMKENTHGNFVSTLENIVTLGIAQDKTYSQLNEEMFNQKESKGNSVGRLAVGIGAGAAIGAGIGSVVPGVGTAIGAGIGAVAGAIIKLWS